MKKEKSSITKWFISLEIINPRKSTENSNLKNNRLQKRARTLYKIAAKVATIKKTVLTIITVMMMTRVTTR